MAGASSAELIEVDDRKGGRQRGVDDAVGRGCVSPEPGGALLASSGGCGDGYGYETQIDKVSRILR